MRFFGGRFLVVPAVLAMLAILPGCDEASDTGSVDTGATVGKHPPALALEPVQDPVGVGEAGLAAYRGKVLVLGFWLGGCAPCLTEMPELVDLHHAYEDKGVEVLLINVGGSPPAVRGAIHDYGMEFAMAMDALSLTASRYQVGVFPTTFVIDRDGVIRARIAGNRRPGTITQTVTDLL